MHHEGHDSDGDIEVEVVEPRTEHTLLGGVRTTALRRFWEEKTAAAASASDVSGMDGKHVDPLPLRPS
jgi:hypothetical protein